MTRYFMARGMTVQCQDMSQPPETREWFAYCVACHWESPRFDEFETASKISYSSFSHPCKRPAKRGRA